MSKKDRKRREAARRQKEQKQAKAHAGENSEEAAASAERREQQRREYEKRKRAKARGSRPLAPYLRGGGVTAMVALAVLGGFLLLGGGGGGSNGTPIVTPDARIAGLPIDVTLTIDSDDDGQNINPSFIPNTISADAGQVVEIVVNNVGSVAHNLHLAGIDDEYDTRDDWLTPTLFSGDTGTVVVKLDDPGTYAFRCDFHPLLQIGTFIVR